MHPFRTISSRPHTVRLRGALLAVALLFAGGALAGPPLLCHPFQTAGAPSLPWGKGWNTLHRGYDVSSLARDTQALLGTQVPVIARMETLRRAAIYASGNGTVARQLAAQLEARVVATKDGNAKDGKVKALALFDAGYFAETLQDIARLQGYDMPGVGTVDMTAVNAILAKGDGSNRIAQAIALRPDDPALRFAAALVSSADERKADYNIHAQLARNGARSDRLLALNIRHVASPD